MLESEERKKLDTLSLLLGKHGYYGFPRYHVPRPTGNLKQMLTLMSQLNPNDLEATRGLPA